MPRFNTFLTVILTFFAFLLAFGGGLLTAIRLTKPLDVQVAAPAPRVIELAPRELPGPPTRTRVSLVIPLDDGLALEAEPRNWRY